MESFDAVRAFLEKLSGSSAPSELTLRRCMSEDWFSDTLAWLLDPNGSHGAGVQFLNEFVKAVARARKEKDCARRATHLKFGKGGVGRGSTTFNFGNAAVLREFFLARGVGRDGLSSSRYCDLVVMDFDTTDGFFLVIENKLFTVNSPGQLRGYLRAVERRFDRADVREYVYLTLDGHNPVTYAESDDRVLERWVPISWTDEIAAILDSLESVLSDEARAVRDLLRWLGRLLHVDKTGAISARDVENFRGLLLHAAGECLLEELRRLNRGMTGEWGVETKSNQTVRLVHSSAPEQWLYVEMLPTFSVTLQTRYNSRDQYEKILVPFGAEPDQVFNQLDVSARDIYYQHFASPDNYLGNKRRLRATLTPKKKQYQELFKFLHRNQSEVQLLLTAEDKVWEAAAREQVGGVPEVDEDVEEGVGAV